MCGIAGFAGEGDRAVLEEMTQTIFHRGPDCSGFYFSSNPVVGLGHQRLSIIDLSGGQQPMSNEDGSLQLIFNGEIYNYQDIRTDLVKKGHRFSTQSDTEVLVHGYEEFGEKILQKLNGMFAFALYDEKNETFFLARDRAGKKPLYYFSDEGRETFIFGSELKTVLKHPRSPKNMDNLSLYKFFSNGYIPAPASIIAGVNKLPAGHFLRYSLREKRLTTSQYWDLSYVPKHSGLSENEQIEGIRDLLEKSVKRRLISDVPLGIFISGGIDSSAIAYYASKNTERRLKSFSISFDEPSFDESHFSRKMALFLGSEHYENRFSADAMLKILPEILSKLDEPMADVSILPTFLLCKFTREHVKVALSGDGNDELFAGYDPFRAQKLADILDSIFPSWVFPRLSTLSALLPASEKNIGFDFALKRFLMGMCYPKNARHNIWMSPVNPHDMGKLFSRDFLPSFLYPEPENYFSNARAREDIDRLIHVWFKTYLQDGILTKLDRAGMQNSLETRCPFLDWEFIEFVAKISPAKKFRKRIFKRAMDGLLPREIVFRAKKGFGVPLTKWLKNELRDVIEAAFNTTFLSKFGINLAVVKTWKEEHFSGKVDHRLFLWALIVLYFWEENLTTQ